MANERIIQINGGTAISRIRNTNDVMELDNSSLGSAQISVANAVGGQVLDYGITTLSSTMLASGLTSVYVIPWSTYPVALPAAPSRVFISIMCNSSNLTTLFGSVVYDATNTNGFQVALSYPIDVGDTTHKITWIAYA